ncbi:hypothetical protein, partial [Nonomuraea indica]|uniref:hypothetical protein n=1 Tax=Nonomuraea indica TaxID=1581193 RepID=UPI001C5DB1FC
MFDAILFAVPVLGLSVTVASAAGSVLLAAHSGPRGRRTRVQRSYVVCGSVLSAIGVATLVCGAWSTHEDAYYDGPGYLLTTSAALLGGHLLLLGLGPFTSWVLGVPARWAGRLPLPARLAAGELADDRPRTAPAVATTMNATAVAVAVTIIAVALTAQHRSEYGPQARHGALVVSAFEEQDTVAVRAAVERALPGVPVAQSFRQRQDGVFRPDMDGVDLPDLEMVSPSEIIGDRALLHYLTADPSTPWDDGTAVVLAAGGVDADTVTIEYDLSGNGESSPATTTIPAIAAEPAAPHLQGIFLPAKVVRDLGYHLEPAELIVDPAIHRTSDSERERLEDSLDGVAATYVEQGYQAPAGWRVVVGATLVVAFAGAVA